MIPHPLLNDKMWLGTSSVQYMMMNCFVLTFLGTFAMFMITCFDSF